MNAYRDDSGEWVKFPHQITRAIHLAFTLCDHRAREKIFLFLNKASLHGHSPYRKNTGYSYVES